jgi:hypothetical protein
MHFRKLRADQYFDLIESEIIDDEKKILEQIQVFTTTSENFETLYDKLCVYRKASQLSANISFNFLEKDNLEKKIGIDDIRFAAEEEGLKISDTRFKNISGIIKAEDEMRMKRMVFRVSKGMAIPTFYDLDDIPEERKNNDVRS